MKSALFHRDVRRWSPADDSLLCELYPRGLEVCRRGFPNRSDPSILGRAKRLGLSRASAGPRRDWTRADEAKLRRLWASATWAVIEAEIPGRSRAVITSKARKMNLAPRNYTARRPIASRNRDPLIAQLAARMMERNFTMEDLDQVSGIGRNVSGRWFADGSRATLTTFAKAVEALGGRLLIVWDDDDPVSSTTATLKRRYEGL